MRKAWKLMLKLMVLNLSAMRDWKDARSEKNKDTDRQFSVPMSKDLQQE